MSDTIRRRPSSARKVAIAQISPVLGDVEANLEKHVEAIEKAKAAGVDLLVFPELSLTGYRLRDTVPEVATAKGGNIAARLASLSEEVSLVVGLVEEDKQHHFYNSAFFAESGGIQSTHRKVYLPTYGMFDEQRYFARGRRLSAFNSKLGRVAVLICEDMLHPTAAVVSALDGAHTLIVPSASPVKGVVGEGEVDQNGRHWEAYNRSMARTLGTYVIYANRVGVEDGIAFWGGSEVIGPSGDTLAKAAYYEEDFIIADVAEEEVRRRRLQSPTLRDEDLDLTINELLRLRQRPERRADQGEARDERGAGHRGGDRGGYRGHDRDRSGRDDRGGGYRGRDDRGGGYRGRDRDARGGGYKGRDDRGGGYRGRDRDSTNRDDRGGGYKGRDDRGGGYRGRDRDERGGGYKARDDRGGGYKGRDDRGGGYRGRDRDSTNRDDRGGGYKARDDRSGDQQGRRSYGRDSRPRADERPRSGDESTRGNRVRDEADRHDKQHQQDDRRDKPARAQADKPKRKARPLDVAGVFEEGGD